jgi:hypothetical protein
MRYSYALLLIGLSLLHAEAAFRLSSKVLPSMNKFIAKQLALGSSPSSVPPFDEPTHQKLNEIVTKNKVVLFMKGDKLFPQW